MNYNIALLGLVEIISAISIGATILSITYKLVIWVGRKYYGIESHNLAFSIFMASMLFAVGYMVSGVIPPLLSSFRLLNTQDAVWLTTFKYLGIGALYITIAFTAAVLIGLLSTALYAKLTPIHEWEEIKNNNTGVAIIIGVIVITLTMMSKSGVALIIESLIPYPELPPI
jgi:uncharacterized membrane protein YjfL (UPF0719 family)